MITHKKQTVTIQGIDLQVNSRRAYFWKNAILCQSDWDGITWAAEALEVNQSDIFSRVAETVTVQVEGAAITYYLNAAYHDSGSVDYIYYITCSYPKLLLP